MSKLALTRAIQFGVFWASITAYSHTAMAQALPAVPDQLKPSAREELLLHALASGDQIYTCDGSKWILSGPDARLSDETGRPAGFHFAGPAWQWSDGSRVTGRPVANATPDPESIPWLLLTATSHEGDGVLKNVSSIQRLHTKGGQAPTSGCTASRKDATARIHYTADYYFYVPRR